MKKGPDPRILDDIARVAGGAVNIVSGLQQQIRDDLRSRVDDMAARMDLVPREELDRALAMIGALRARVDGLEDRLAKLEGGKAKTAAPKGQKAATPKKKIQGTKGRKA